MISFSTTNDKPYSNMLKIQINTLTPEELAEFNRIMQNDIIPVWLEDRESIRWNGKFSNRKKMNESIINTVFSNKYGLDYKRKDIPLIVTGINECMRQNQKGNLRLLIVNKAGSTFHLIDGLIIQCIDRNIPVIPLHLSVSDMSIHLSSDTRSMVNRVCCIGITNKPMISRSLLSSLLVLENYYISRPHVLPTWNKPAIQTKPLVTRIEKPLLKRKCRFDRMKKKQIPLFHRIDSVKWLEERSGSLQWILSKSQTKQVKRPSLDSLESQGISKKVIVERKEDCEVVSIPSVPSATTQETTNKKPKTIAINKQLLQERMKKNPLFRFK